MLCALGESSWVRVWHRGTLETGLKLRTEGPHFLFPLRDSESCKPNAHLLQPFSPPPLITLLDVVRKPQRMTSLGKSEFSRATRCGGAGRGLVVRRRDSGWRTKDQRRAGSADSRDAGSRCRGWKAVGTTASPPVPVWTEDSDAWMPPHCYWTDGDHPHHQP